MDDHEFIKKALLDGFSIKLVNGKLQLSKYNKQIPLNHGTSYRDFLKHFNETSQDPFFKPGSNNDLYPGPVGMHPKGMITSPEDFDREYEIDKDLDIDVPPFARYDPILPEDRRKKDKKKRSGDPNPDHLRKPGNGDDYFL